MSEFSNSTLSRGVKIIVDLIYGLLIGACVFLILWITIAPVIMKSGFIPITASVPVAVGVGADPQMEVQIENSAAKGISASFVDGAHGTLRLETYNWIFVFTSNLSKLLVAIGLAYVFYLLRLVLRAINEGQPFTPENSRRIRKMGYMVLLIAFLRPTIDYIAANEILNQLKIVTPSLSPPSTFTVETILASLLILILAQIWSYGLELERDRELTI
jgi:hypothetical protein